MQVVGYNEMLFFFFFRHESNSLFHLPFCHFFFSLLFLAFKKELTMSIKENREKQVSLYLSFFIRHTCVCRSLTSFQTLDNKGCGGLDNEKRGKSLCVYWL